MMLNGRILTGRFTPPPANCGACTGSGTAGGTITLNDVFDLQAYNVNGTNTLMVLDPDVDLDGGPQQVIQGYLPIHGSDYANVVVTFP
jgi:hypothetical protein